MLLIWSCSEKGTESKKLGAPKRPIEKIEVSFQQILDSAQLAGSILIFSENKNTFYSNDFVWANLGQLPASTFKIPNSIIGLETGVVESDSSIFIWDGEERAMESWEHDLTLKEAFLRSCVPCYQEIARKVGVQRMRNWIEKLQYGKIKMDSATLDRFWLEGDSRITPFQQIDFLRRLANSELPISDRTDSLIKKIMILQEKDAYTLRAKTGWSIVDNRNNGWFVGYLNRAGKKYFFATNVEPMEGFSMDDFAQVRSAVTLKALKNLGAL